MQITLDTRRKVTEEVASRVNFKNRQEYIILMNENEEEEYIILKEQNDEEEERGIYHT